jgi:hypothetical protein
MLRFHLKYSDEYEAMLLVIVVPLRGRRRRGRSVRAARWLEGEGNAEGE